MIREIVPTKTRYLVIIMIIIFLNPSFFTLCCENTVRNRVQPNNALVELEIGFSTQSDDFFGWNISNAGNLNGDQYDDIIVGAPGNDSSGENAGAVYIFFGNASGKLSDINAFNADIVIIGEKSGDLFGWDVASAGDFNGDGLDDVIIGAPNTKNNTGKAYVFYGGSLQNSSADNVDRSWNSVNPGDLFGFSVSFAGNVDNDGCDDVIIGSPGADKAYIYYGQQNYKLFYPNLSELEADSETPEVDFTNGINTSANTYGPSGSNDGWDWNLTGVYGGDNSSVVYNVDPNSDNNIADSTVATNGELIIRVGHNYGDSTPGPDSGAYGVDLQITTAMFTSIQSGAKAIFSFNWSFNTWGFGGLDANEEAWIKARFGTSTQMFYLGTNLDALDDNVDSSNEIWWADDPPNTDSGTFIWDVTSHIASAGYYYLDFGGKVRTWTTSPVGGEAASFHFDNILLKISNERPAVTLKGLPGTSFGSCVAGLGDVNGSTPSYDDVAVSAPLTPKGSTYLFHGGSTLPPIIPIADADIKLTGIETGELFGWSVSGAGNINNDNYNDVIIGAPGADRTYVFFGRSSFPGPLYPDLWDDNTSTPNTVDFNLPGNEVNSLANTFGLSSPPSASDNDGWDWANGTYGQSGTLMAHHYDPEPETEGLTFDGSKRLEVQIGRSHAGDGPTDESLDSAAWGVQINISPMMYMAIVNGGEAIVSFDWEAQDTESSGSGTEEPSYIKARFGNSTGYYYLGNNLGGDPEPEIFFHESGGMLSDPWTPAKGFFQGSVTKYITQPDWYYFDFGAKLNATGGVQGINEGIRTYFDNISMTIFPRIPQDILINGTSGDKFGFSVSSAGKLNNDDFGDIIIGAPGNDTPNGIDSGAVYVFLGNGTMNSNLDASLDADYINYGEAFNDSFGRAVAHAGSVDGDAYSEVLVGAPFKDSLPPSLLSDVGKVYVYGLLKRPIISLIYPIGGEVINGEIIINATATDPDNNIDTVGVRFYYSTDKINWTYLGNNPTPDGTFYTMIWNTSELNDSTYFIKVNVTDLELNLGEDISGVFTVDNQFSPEVNILNPVQNEIIYGQYSINATGFDNPKDQIGGGINNTIGMRFYYSEDNITWHYLGNDTTPEPGNLFQFNLDTTTLIDGKYGLKVNITDFDNMIAEDIVEFEIDNPQRIPSVNLLSPRNVNEVSGIITINATAFDMDNDINSTGVSFYYSKNEVNWVFINNDSTPDINLIYEINWDTRATNDGWYRVKAFVNDTTGLSNESKSNKFLIHNTLENQPTLKVIFPNNGEELNGSVKLKASALDIDNNIDTKGVEFYYSSDKIEWTFIGNNPNPDTLGGNNYSYIWNTLKVPDGRYWLNVSANDTTFLTGWDHSDTQFFIHNTLLNPPFVDVKFPNGGEILIGNIILSASACDLENNINDEGVRFYYSLDKINWTLINNVPNWESETSIAGFYYYNLSWDTNTVEDGEYWLKANATDTDNLDGEDISDGPFYIHNGVLNPPIVKVIFPNGGEEVNGTVILKASALDLEDNINPNGVKFYYFDDDKYSWKLIGNISESSSADNKMYKLTWDTTTVPDGVYWLKANATDLTNLEGFDISDDSFIIHNNPSNPPKIKIIYPQTDDTVNQTIAIQVEVTDFEDDVVEVRFYYSEDNETWVLIGTATEPTEPGGNIYSLSWDTEDVYDGKHWLKVIAVDNDSLEGVAYSGPFTVENGIVKPEEKDSKDELAGPWWLWIIIIIILILFLIFIVIFFKRKKDKQKKEDEVQEPKFGEEEPSKKGEMELSEEEEPPEKGEEHLEEEPSVEEQEESPTGSTEDKPLEEKSEEEEQIQPTLVKGEKIKLQPQIKQPRIVPKVKLPESENQPENFTDAVKSEPEIENDEE